MGRAFALYALWRAFKGKPLHVELPWKLVADMPSGVCLWVRPS